MFPELVHRPVQIRPLAADLDVGLVDAPTPRLRPAPLPAQTFLHLRRETLHPTIDRGVVDRDAALGHHRFEVAVADRIPAVPAHGPEHDLPPEVTSLEVAYASTPRSRSRRQVTNQPDFATEPAGQGWIAWKPSEPAPETCRPAWCRWACGALPKVTRDPRLRARETAGPQHAVHCEDGERARKRGARWMSGGGLLRRSRLPVRPSA